MKRTTISMNDELLHWCEDRAKQLSLTTSQFFRILAHNERARKTEGINIISEQNAMYGGAIINHPPKRRKR